MSFAPEGLLDDVDPPASGARPEPGGDACRMHRHTRENGRLARAVLRHALARLKADPPPLGRTVPGAALDALAGDTITGHGLGAAEALRVFSEIIAPCSISTDHPAYLAYVPTAPTQAAKLFDLTVSAFSFIGSGWIDGGGAIWAENQALRWIADLAGMGPDAGGCFVAGGSAGNLSALTAARHVALQDRIGRPPRWKLVVSAETHASVVSAAGIMDADIVTVPTDARGRMLGSALDRTLSRTGTAEVFAVVATAGTTNAGVIDDLQGIAGICAARKIWMHVDAAYGGGALCTPSMQGRFAGIERADSVIVDPHKWLYAPYDCCALLYARPRTVIPAFTQEASYLDDANATPEWNPMHYAFHLTRRPRGLPLWFSLATYGTDCYRQAVESVLTLTRQVAAEITRRPQLELILEPELSTVLFRRRGWTAADYQRWSQRILAAQIGFVLPTTWRDQPVVRMCFISPETTLGSVLEILDSLA